MRITSAVRQFLSFIRAFAKAAFVGERPRRLLAIAGKTLFAIGVSCVLAVSANAAHCRCEITCTAADGKTFTRTNSPFPNYQQGLESERNRCESSCNQWVGSSIQGWSDEEKVCGGVNCSGTSHVGDEPRKKWNNVAGAGHNRVCCPPASNGQGCPPMVCTDITSVFRLTQTGDVTSLYNLIYDVSMKPCLDAAFQAYANYVGTQVPGMTHMWVGYGIDDLTNPPDPSGWFAVKYTVNATGGGVPSVSVINPPLQVGHTYRVRRGVFFKNAQDQDLPFFGDPSCKLPSFTITIAVTVSKQATRPGRATARAVATIRVEGQPDREVAIETRPDRDRIRQFEALPSVLPQDVQPPESVKPPDHPRR